MRILRTAFAGVLACAFIAPSAFAQGPAAKKPLDHDSYDIWNRIAGQSISDDGRWVLYGLASEANDPRLMVKQVSGNGAFEIECGEAGEFSEDSRFVVFRIKAGKEAVKQAKKDKVKADQMPQDSMGILDLSNGSFVRMERVKSFKLPEEGTGWVAYQLIKDVPADSAAAGGAGRAGGGQGRAGGGGRRGGGPGAAGGAAGEKKKEEGSTLVVRNLLNGQERRVENVVAYEFSKDGATLAYTTGDKDGTSDGAFAMKTSSGQTTTLLSGKGDYKGLAIDDAGVQVAFLSDRDDFASKQPAYTLYQWDGKAAQAKAIASTKTTGVPSGWWVSENETPSFSDNGQRLFFGTAPIPVPDPPVDSSKIDEEKVSVDIWNWKDPYLQPMQLKQLEQERRRTYTAVASLKDAKVVQLATLDMPEIVQIHGGDSDIALGRSDLPYRQEVSWGESGNDIYLVDLRTGAKDKALEHVGNASPSPEGKYVSWWDGDKRAWFVMDVASKQIVEASKGIPDPVFNELHDSPSDPGSYGSAGWTKGDAQFLVYDAYDIWATDPTGKTAPRNITEGVGRKEDTRFRYVDPARASGFGFGGGRGGRGGGAGTAIDPDKEILLSSFGVHNKTDGFYRDRVKGNPPPAKLTTANKSIGAPRKAEDADVMLFTMGSFSEFPDLYVSGPDFKDPKRISDANPQQAQYSWGTSELVEWRSAQDGEMLQGVLYKPEGFDASKKYPMMVYFYERLSDQLNNYVVPAAGGSSINISFYVSRGYLVFTPDIPYRIGYPGESSLKAVVPGVLSLIDKGFVDKDNIGVQGHSWGGYQIGYLVTKTNIFKAAEAGAPVSDMVSAYGGIRWGTGMSRMFQYEKTQSRIGGTLWEAPMHFIENSPIFWADKVETPLLMMHNDEDGAVPWEQGIEYFTALRRLNKPSWLIVYNGEDHGLRKEINRKDWTIRMQQFFDHYLKGAPAPVWLEEGVPALQKGKTLGLELIGPKATTFEEAGGGGKH